MEPLDASKISKQEACVALSDISQKKLMNQQTYWTHECLLNPKPISDEEAWEATLAWAETKAQEREAAALKAASQTNTDESYDCDEDDFGNFDGNVYEGEWNAAEQREGHGKYVWPSGAVYEGEWKADKREGRGKYVFDNGDVYEGEFKADKREGHGIHRSVDGDVYEGQFKAGKRDGIASERSVNGDVYEGEFKADKREGHGKYVWPSGAVYEGEWKADKMEGFGKYVWTNSDVYEGEWKAGHREGRGTELTDGGVYEGEWKTGYREGCGIYWFANGDVYEGEFKADKREGRGILRSVNGDVYDGEWKGGKKEGRDKYVFTDDEDSSGDEDASGSEDDEEFPLAAMAGLMRRGTILEEKKAWNISDAAAAAAMWRDDAVADAYESVAVAKAIEKLAARATARVAAATIIQAAERGRAARARDAQIMDWLASDIRHIECARYLTRSNDNNGIDLISEFADKFAEQWAVSRKCLDFTSWAESVH